MTRRYVLMVAIAFQIAGCRREERNSRPEPARVAIYEGAATESTLQPGGALPVHTVQNPYQGNATAIAEGQRLYGWYNCGGCHSHGGGGIGPPLIKKAWIYGGEDANIFDTIVKGRPNGMPTWGGRIPEYQIWQIAAYVRSMNKEEPNAATPARSDELEQNSNTVLDRRMGKTQ